MKNPKIIVIIIFCVIAITLIFWSNTENNNNTSLGYYRTDLEGFKSVYGELTNSLDIFFDSPNIENYAEVQFII